ncbi:hypothetical protein [Paenibacillus alkalitolerans]|uniref:hypothetical protein n=1 Tax=Paenibacillus alkalitolerans TaxID=2799335 RepID=UPI0018F639F8|nr:hypothetical protein [Paenibacillus alkalitolerans]
MEFLKSWDWSLISFVGTSLLNEYMSHPLPSIHYWNGEREYRNKMRERQNGGEFKK